MADSGAIDQLSVFLKSGVCRLGKSNAIYIDPVQVLDRSYTRYRISRSSYYSRFFGSKSSVEEDNVVHRSSRKRKRKQKKFHTLNQREQVADERHQMAKPLLLKAHESLLEATDLLNVIRNLSNEEVFAAAAETGDDLLQDVEQSFVELGSVWQAPLYEITINFHTDSCEGTLFAPCCNKERVIPVFNNLVANETSSDAEAKFLNNRYILPKESCFYMSDLKLIHNLIPAESDCGFNLIVIDPPWENSSASQKMKYPTLPNRYFLSLPIKKIAHRNGALVALWVTNREKYRDFVEKELFPTWGVKYVASLYWLKIKADGSLISELDLFHHRPYECLLLGYCHGEVVDSEFHSRLPADNQVVISVPGDYSRKPPIGDLLMEYVPGPKPARCIELFAREMLGGWTSWGNEVLHFQDSKYFIKAPQK